MNTGQYLDQSRLPGSVLSDQAMDFSGPDLNMHVVHGYDTREPFCNILQLHHIIGHWCITLLSLCLRAVLR